MADSSSPTSSCSSSRSSPFLLPEFSSLPVMSLRHRIVDKILENRVTLIVGETGCGKSSQIPQFLLEENMEPILCTQPRRFAVVAVAKMVAKARNCELGGEVGYHIGHERLLSARSKIVFKTAGVLLEEMRDKGLNALKYKVIILDEVHERSVESDLVLVCVKQFLLRNNDLRVVLMSATADFGRYRDYFKDLGREERVEVLAIPSSNNHALYQRRVSYLEQVTELLGINSESLASRDCSGQSLSTEAADINPEVHKLIHHLVLHIHENEPDIEKGILVFLPTYHDLEQQWYLLRPLSSRFKVHILHGSVGTKQAFSAMRIWKSHRKVILATNIAESSVTIPHVAYVIDSCRSLQVFWDATRKNDSAELVWVSKSQADQRKGRTGRTCDGQIYRLVTRSFFNKLQDHESPAILRLSLRRQVLMVSCSESKAINDPRVLLQKVLDPPDPQVVEGAIDLLVHLKALDRASSRGRYEPTFYGRLLASFCLSFEASVLVTKFGDIGLLHEGILLGVLMDAQPLPILHPFGEEHLFAEYTYHYFGGDCDNVVQIGKREMILIGNLCAYQFWQRVFKDKHRLEHLKQLSNFNEMNAVTSLLPKIEEEWCSFHNLVQMSLHQVSEMYEDILNSLHHFRPRFLCKCDCLPTYYNPYEFRHVCLLECQPNGDTNSDDPEVEYHNSSCGTKKCCAVPFVSSKHFQTVNVAENLSTIVKEMRVQLTDTYKHARHVNDHVFDVNEEATLCVYFNKGSCNKGTQCSFSHSLQAKRPICRFFSSLQGCRNGESCNYSHDLGPSIPLFSLSPCLPEDDDVNTASLLQYFPTSSDGCILLFDDTDLHFSSNFARHYDPSKIVSSTCLTETTISEPLLTGVRVLWGLQHPYQTIFCSGQRNLVAWSEIKCALWFLNLDDHSENLEEEKILVQNFFKYLAIRIIADSLYELRVIIVMNNIRFSQLQVEKLGREGFFFLRGSFPFDESSFGGLSDTVRTKKPMTPSRPISYVFDLHPPTDIQFDDYAATLSKCLHDLQGCT
ncbi:DExH-box ATP-dependent RNA helicase DExH8 [Euphorbia lathyris]|uniref:DExH-box ATP-dependent RNA helicase DExH8 n=1 Tax=Euphorbia lathyris TaxID=212925 RepID=UPI0033131A66